jgi:hypothetical protein
VHAVSLLESRFGDTAADQALVRLHDLRTDTSARGATG